MINVGFVVVNYNNYEDTIACVESIIKMIDTESFRIVIVDNNSPNGSGEILQKQYSSIEKVDVVLSGDNLGNSGGWQTGISFLKSKYNPSFVVLSDNDIVLLDNSFFKHIKSEHSTSKCAVIGPMIITPDGRCDDNPIFDIWYSRENATYDLHYWKKRLTATKLGMDKIYCFLRSHNIFTRIQKKKKYTNRKIKIDGGFLQRKENVVLHGCFLILCPTYFEHFEGIDVRTFMYAEEDILFAHLIKEELNTTYFPDICVYHKGGASVKSSFRKNKKQKIFLFQNYIKAIEQYIELLDELQL